MDKVALLGLLEEKRFHRNLTLYVDFHIKG